ncbi:MAG: 2-oxoglutarate dehydrogenase complex dihydrolipoyllysine-residue succinyltransferase [Roseiflexaceae bacterium]
MAVEIRVPTLGESIVEATVGKWLKKVGDTVKQGEPLVELETDKVNIEVNADQSGVLGRIDKAEGADVSIGQVLGLIEATGAAPAATAPAPAPTAAAAPPAEPAPNGREDVDANASPVARRMAEVNNVDLAGVQGSGPGGRILKNDVSSQIQRQAAPASPAPAPASAPAAPAPVAAAPAAAPAPAPSTASGRPEERVKMTRRRQTIARRLVEAQRTAAMLTTFNEVDMSAIAALRKRRGDEFLKRHGIKLGFMSFFTKAVVGALKAFPRLNAEIQGDELLLKHYYDIGIAVGAEEGLVVPVVRDADRKNFAALEREIADLGKRARDNTLTLAELQGGTFTITNGGIFGSLMSTPILNAPQVGILGMHAIKDRPVVVNGEIAVRPMMYIALSYDHRIVDGSEAVRFLVRIKELVEDPETLLLDA